MSFLPWIVSVFFVGYFICLVLMIADERSWRRSVTKFGDPVYDKTYFTAEEFLILPFFWWRWLWVHLKRGTKGRRQW